MLNVMLFDFFYLFVYSSQAVLCVSWTCRLRAASALAMASIVSASRLKVELVLGSGLACCAGFSRVLPFSRSP